MTKSKMLVGSLSNDLFRVASLTQRGSLKAATRFLREAQRWSKDLKSGDVADYIQKIADEISSNKGKLTIPIAEKYLMYGVLLQNYSLKIK